MKRLALGLAAAVTGLVVVPNLASALSAVTTESTELRAGPALDFPVVDQIPSDVRVNVHGCVRGYSWCDVSWRDARGWIQAARERGSALLVSSHTLSEVERLCDRIAILNEGRLAASGALAELAAPGESLEDVFVRVVRG